MKTPSRRWTQKERKQLVWEICNRLKGIIFEEGDNHTSCVRDFRRVAEGLGLIQVLTGPVDARGLEMNRENILATIANCNKNVN
ncbi:MAG: hypothetical protein HY507_01095 [Candidatus Zambryskibacteria bacterium]|nr:hypothetical protein [Candidatus Zambryskibacteria bacterium]